MWWIASGFLYCVFYFLQMHDRKKKKRRNMIIVMQTVRPEEMCHVKS